MNVTLGENEFDTLVLKQPQCLRDHSSLSPTMPNAIPYAPTFLFACSTCFNMSCDLFLNLCLWFNLFYFV